MTKRVYIIHGWGGFPKEKALAWLGNELEKKRDFEVYIPEMPDTEEPKIKPWVSKINEVVSKPDKNTYFVGHSIGCQAIMRYLQTLENKKIGGAVFIAPWFELTEFTYKEEPKYEEDSRAIAKPQIKKPINLEKVKNSINNLTAIFSDNDPYVLVSDSEIFKKELSAKIIIESNKGHFTEDDGVTEFPIVLEELLKMSK